jgi:hypothetical protein
MHTLNPFFVESLETRAEVQKLRALQAHNGGDSEKRDFYNAAADATRAKLNKYKQESFLWMKIGQIVKAQCLTVGKVETDPGTWITPPGP